MKEYKRFTKYNKYNRNLKVAEVYAYTIGNEDVYFDGIDIVGNENSSLAQETIDKLAILEDKIENGTLIELPCKVGTIIYQIYKDCSNCPHFKETGWEYDCWCDFDSEESKTMFEFDGDDDCVYIIKETEFSFNHIKDFGKTVFLTKAEAEKKLESLKNDLS